MLTCALVAPWLGARSRLLVLVVSSACAAVLGTRAGREARTGRVSDAVDAVAAPVAAPAGLLLEATIAAPDATWRKAQLAVGGVLILAPSTFGGIIGALARNTTLGTMVDGVAPAYAVMDERRRWVVVASLVSPDLARSTLVTPEHPHERVGDVELVRIGTEQWVGLAQHWVLVGSDREALTTLGPYAYRTLPTRGVGRSMMLVSVGEAALAGPVRDELMRRVDALKTFLLAKDEEERRVHGGRAPDLADPKPLVDLGERLARRYVGIVASM